MNDVVDLIERHKPDMMIYVGLSWRGLYVSCKGFATDKGSIFWARAPASTVTRSSVLDAIISTNICHFLKDFTDLEFTIVSKLE